MSKETNQYKKLQHLEKRITDLFALTEVLLLQVVSLRRSMKTEKCNLITRQKMEKLKLSDLNSDHSDYSESTNSDVEDDGEWFSTPTLPDTPFNTPTKTISMM